jgi:hypothetical protein
MTADFMLIRTLLFLSLFCLSAGESSAQTIKDGVFILAPTEKPTNITFAGNMGAELGRHLKPDEYTMVIRSISNWNDSFQVEIAAKDPSHPFQQYPPNPGIFVGGRLILDMGAGRDDPIDAAMARRIAAICHAKLVLRKTMGNELAIRFKTDKPEYNIGSPITLSILVKNVGSKPVFLRPESLAQPERSGMLTIARNTAIGINNEPVDVQDPYDRMSLIGPVAQLNPGAVLEIRRENFWKWYKLAKAGLYRFVGTYEVDLYNSPKDDQPAWVEWLGDEFSISISQEN